ncbi:MAG: hypothetical protein PHR07_03920 [Acidaminococcaceae bacterium]|nr:hypothetical protein [Acidaminococcaceae bacterium]
MVNVLAFFDSVLGKNRGVSDTNGLPVKLSGSTAIVGVVDVVTTATTREALAAHACREVIIIAKDTNTGYIYIGGSDVSATVYGAKLAAGDSITIPISNTNLIYMDASVSGEGISYLAVS